MAKQNLKNEKENTAEEKILIALRDRSGKLKKNSVGKYLFVLNPGGIIIPVSPKKVRSEDQDSDQDQDSSFNSTLSTEKSSDDEVHWNDERLENIDIRQE
ncbi:hypothetical protein KQX54_009156 [Cotesia glomerata]|uniref:Uncharacterized protein n=1 Tax=Cotesia glomerata TaxID=32391 RepID=A0AAV7IJZ0_COTGL|nr:hypothetical protein KQX54_009156 [Cotesia glomerata]